MGVVAWAERKCTRRVNPPESCQPREVVISIAKLAGKLAGRSDLRAVLAVLPCRGDPPILCVAKDGFHTKWHPSCHFCVKWHPSCHFYVRQDGCHLARWVGNGKVCHLPSGKWQMRGLLCPRAAATEAVVPNPLPPSPNGLPPTPVWAVGLPRQAAEAVVGPLPALALRAPEEEDPACLCRRYRRRLAALRRHPQLRVAQAGPGSPRPPQRRGQAAVVRVVLLGAGVWIGPAAPLRPFCGREGGRTTPRGPPSPPPSGRGTPKNPKKTCVLFA